MKMPRVDETETKKYENKESDRRLNINLFNGIELCVCVCVFLEAPWNVPLWNLSQTVISRVCTYVLLVDRQ